MKRLIAVWLEEEDAVAVRKAAEVGGEAVSAWIRRVVVERIVGGEGRTAVEVGARQPAPVARPTSGAPARVAVGGLCSRHKRLNCSRCAEIGG
jgi:hypothetical protein